MNFENVQVFRSDPRTNVGGLSVIEFGKQHVSGLISERRLPDYAAVFVEKGRGTLTTEQGGIQEVIGPALFWLFPNSLHSYGPDKSTMWLERWALFRGSMIDDFQRKGFLNPAQPLIMPVNFSEVAHTFSTLHSEMLKRDAIGWASAAATIHRLVVQMASKSTDDKSTNFERQRKRLAEIVEERAFEKIDFEKLALDLQMSPATLRRKCVALLGMAPKHYQLQLRIDRAKEVLVSTSKSIEEIARSVGYEDSFYFSRLFFKREHLSPTEFRKLHVRA
jgi:AraC family transcriptional regulator, arabinose operon regulatory protein